MKYYDVNLTMNGVLSFLGENSKILDLIKNSKENLVFNLTIGKNKNPDFNSDIIIFKCDVKLYNLLEYNGVIASTSILCAPSKNFDLNVIKNKSITLNNSGIKLGNKFEDFIISKIYYKLQLEYDYFKNKRELIVNLEVE